MSSQFPPSSPLRDDKENEDPFSLKGKEYIKPKADDRGRVRFDIQYPTPNPSSSLARSSSPHYEPEEPEEPEEYEQSQQDEPQPRKISFHVDKPIMKDIIGSDVKITKIPLNKSQLIIGRSSQTSDIAIKTKQKFISRNHLKVTKHLNELEIECLGHNGFGITIPRACGVTQLNDNIYKLHEIETNEVKRISGELSNSSIKLETNCTEFLVRHKEILRLPLISNIIVEIKNHLLLLNPRTDSEDEETDEEIPMKQGSEDLGKTNRSQKGESQAETPIKSNFVHPSTPAKRSFKITSEESTPLKKFQKSSSVLSDKTNVAHKPFKKSKSEEPKKSAKTKKQPVKDQLQQQVKEGTPTPQDSLKDSQFKPSSKTNSRSQTPEPEVSLDGIKDIQGIKNILVNHLAFSRLSSTPMSILKNISGNINDLTNGQLKQILAETQPIGIISRQGKDAAGKPLEEEYYYIPEQDDDTERPKLVSSIKGHGGIRSCRRVHKQYFWRKPAPIKKDKK